MGVRTIAIRVRTSRSWLPEAETANDGAEELFTEP
jgi:hypothetical protein